MSECKTVFTGHCRSDALHAASAVLETNLVGDIVRTCVLHLHHHIRVQEVGLDHIWYERRILLLENDGHDVVAYVPLPLQLESEDKQNLQQRKHLK